MDRDTTPIGGLSNPLPPTHELYHATLVMDAIAFLAAFLISTIFAIGILLYILASRAYSYRGIRLKKYPVTGFLTVFIFQGALIFYISYHGTDSGLTTNIPLLPCLIASLLIGALYPLTQIYQHEEDRKDGVVSISALMGERGSFLFSGILFISATLLLFIRFSEMRQQGYFYLFLVMMLPVVLFFLYWMRRVWKDRAAASFSNSLRMNVLSTFCTILFFITLIMLNH
jgi:1,4-dihydroxy-2-naphthoate octaprenyltransferase